MTVSVPVVDSNGLPLMPTSPRRAARWVKSRKATPFWSRGVWCVRMNVEPSGRKMQPIAVGIDPGSKREGFTVKSKAKTFLNVLAHAVDWVKRGSLVKHLKYGLCYVGGTRKDRISLHLLRTGERICCSAKTSETKFVSFGGVRFITKSIPILDQSKIKVLEKT